MRTCAASLSASARPSPPPPLSPPPPPLSPPRRPRGRLGPAPGGGLAGREGVRGERAQRFLAPRRATGQKVALDGLSEGTSDQLFLVLRLALLERRRLEPLPFVGDDLLASFDEP